MYFLRLSNAVTFWKTQIPPSAGRFDWRSELDLGSTRYSYRLRSSKYIDLKVDLGNAALELLIRVVGQ